MDLWESWEGMGEVVKRMKENVNRVHIGNLRNKSKRKEMY